MDFRSDADSKKRMPLPLILHRTALYIKFNCCLAFSSDCRLFFSLEGTTFRAIFQAHGNVFHSQGSTGCPPHASKYSNEVSCEISGNVELHQRIIGRYEKSYVSNNIAVIHRLSDYNARKINIANLPYFPASIFSKTKL
jgi:hypothetical protein